MKTFVWVLFLIGSSCLAQQSNSHNPDLSRLAEELRRLHRETPKLDAPTLKRIETLRLHLDSLEAERARKAQEELLRQKETDKPGDHWNPGELDRLRKRPA